MRESIIIKAWFWRMVLGAAKLWCRFCRWLHGHADNLCGWVGRKAGGEIGVEEFIEPHTEPVEL